MNRPSKNSDPFEIEVFEFLEEFHKKGLIKDLGGGQKNTLETGQQIDISFEFHNKERSYLFVLECKSRANPNLKKSVEELKIRYDQVQKVYKPKYCPEHEIIPILVLDNNSEELNFNLNSLDLLNFNYRKLTRDFIDYYKKLLKDYGPEYTFPIFLKEVTDILVDYGGKIKVPCLKVERFGKTLYTFTIKASDLLKLSYVYRARPGTVKAEAYQRLLDPSRIKAISELLREKKFEVNFPNNIIANIESDHISFTSNNNSYVGVLEIENKFGRIWIIDGQHRLYSFLHAPDIKEDFELIVTAFVDLKYAEQSKIFATINSSAKKVTPDLIDYLFSLELPRNYIGSASKVCINLSEKGIFDDNRLYLGFEKPRKRTNYLGIHAIVRVLTNEKKYNLITHKGGNLRKDKDDEENPENLLSYYFNSIKNNFRYDWNKGKDGFVKTADGLAIFLGILDKIMKNQPKDLDKLTQKDFDRYLKKLKKVNWRKMSERSSSSESDRQKVLKDLLRRIRL